jgi:methionine biosynthesis protein MetW
MSTSAYAKALKSRRDLQVIASWIPESSRVLDLGCGDGTLLSGLQDTKRCSGYGVEIADAAVLACTQRGVNVIQCNVEEGLTIFAKTQFDFVVSSMVIQATQRTEQVLREMGDVGRECIVSLPNFGHWYHIWSLVWGRMPISDEMPYQWYDTPNLHLATMRDFELLLDKLNLKIIDRCFLDHGRQVRLAASMRATQAIYRFKKF